MKTTLLIGIVIVSAAIFSCFAYSFYRVDQLQSQISDLQSHNGYMVVLNYNWTVQSLGSLIYKIVVNATLLNDSPYNVTNYNTSTFSVDYPIADVLLIGCQFGNKTDIGYLSYGVTFTPYMTKNEGFTFQFNAFDYYNMTSPDSIWLQPTTIQA